jgi:D-glycero-alpha-D-manno-heptose 1-phosphate guanylyltransferase
LTVGGKPFIEWTLATLSDIGISQVVISAGYLAASIETHFRAPRSDGLVVRVVVEPAPLGTGGAIAFAAHSAPDGDPVLVANGDSCIAGGLSMIWSSLDQGIDGVLVAVQVGDSGRFGRLQISADGLLTGLGENQVGTGWINAGVYLLRRRVLDRFPAQVPLSFEREVIPLLIATGVRLRVLRIQAPFIDIGIEASLKEADSFVSAFLDKRTQP